MIRAQIDYALVFDEFMALFVAEFAIEQWLGPRASKPFSKDELRSILEDMHAAKERLQQRMSELQPKLDAGEEASRRRRGRDRSGSEGGERGRAAA